MSLVSLRKLCHFTGDQKDKRRRDKLPTYHRHKADDGKNVWHSVSVENELDKYLHIRGDKHSFESFIRKLFPTFDN